MNGRAVPGSCWLQTLMLALMCNFFGGVGGGRNSRLSLCQSSAFLCCHHFSPAQFSNISIRGSKGESPFQNLH